MEVLRSTAAAETGKKRNGGCRITSGVQREAPTMSVWSVTTEGSGYVRVKNKKTIISSEGKQKRLPTQAIHEDIDVTTAQVRD